MNRRSWIGRVVAGVVSLVVGPKLVGSANESPLLKMVSKKPFRCPDIIIPAKSFHGNELMAGAYHVSLNLPEIMNEVDICIWLEDERFLVFAGDSQIDAGGMRITEIKRRMVII